MNHRAPGQIPFSRAITGFVNYKTAEGLSLRTVAGYQDLLEDWVKYTGDMPVSKVRPSDISNYLNYMRTEYVPRRLSGDTRPLAPKTLRNFYITFASFFTWASKELGVDNPVKEIPAPRFQRNPVNPFTQEELQRMLKACLYAREAAPSNRRRFVMRRHTANRDEAIILTLVDSGLRASELCSLKIEDFDPKRGALVIKHGVEGGAKGGKGRTVYLGKTARSAVWRYLAGREDGEEPGAPLFVVFRSRPFTRSSLEHLIKRIGDRAGVKNAYPHKFRHTFAIMYLRSGGDVFTLQILLGHGSLDMVRYYAQIAQVDVEQAHNRASPADHWRL